MANKKEKAQLMDLCLAHNEIVKLKKQQCEKENCSKVIMEILEKNEIKILRDIVFTAKLFLDIEQTDVPNFISPFK